MLFIVIFVGVSSSGIGKGNIYYDKRIKREQAAEMHPAMREFLGILG